MIALIQSHPANHDILYFFKLLNLDCVDNLKICQWKRRYLKIINSQTLKVYIIATYLVCIEITLRKNKRYEATSVCWLYWSGMTSVYSLSLKLLWNLTPNLFFVLLSVIIDERLNSLLVNFTRLWKIMIYLNLVTLKLMIMNHGDLKILDRVLILIFTFFIGKWNLIGESTWLNMEMET